ncbi:aminotransferase class I/II-fold pyridoxal phosphate-dependent enzyme [Brachyspira hyodysenteriae]|nr:aminotransferase class I/II-fold pyridoxal phosphate-dependent enzyme [Brachyspira hyodysenteriae]MCZ9996350.1 aminotransferase class I/II-fold pyridoxal phosphate-dependent enzyme [Brachyspira hyodysenteriae]
MLANPSNPTGVVYTKKEFDDIAYIAKRAMIYLV